MHWKYSNYKLFLYSISEELLLAWCFTNVKCKYPPLVSHSSCDEVQAGKKNLKNQEFTEGYSVALPVKTVYLNAEKQNRSLRQQPHRHLNTCWFFVTRQAAQVLLNIINNLNKLAIYHSWVIPSKSFKIQKIPIYCADINYCLFLIHIGQLIIFWKESHLYDHHLDLKKVIPFSPVYCSLLHTQRCLDFCTKCIFTN